MGMTLRDQHGYVYVHVAASNTCLLSRATCTRSNNLTKICHLAAIYADGYVPDGHARDTECIELRIGMM